MKKVLILGAGMVAKPMIDYFLNSGEIYVISATRTLSKAERIIKDRDNATIVKLIADDDLAFERLITQANVVVSLLPYAYHVKTAYFCLKHQKHLVTTSYVSPEMNALHAEAERQNVIILNEIGLDPGIDHMSAMRIIDNVHQRGGKIEAFRSYCGGFPSPGANNNPWRYKFSWSPKGVLMAGRNSAHYLKNGKIVHIDGRDLFEHHWPIKIENLELETYPNRDSLQYIKLYNIPETNTMFRGTLRYPGWCRTMRAVGQLKLLEEKVISNIQGLSNGQIFQKILDLRSDQDPRKHIHKILEIDENDEIIKKLEWLGIFSGDKFSGEQITPIDFLSTIMMDKLRYEDNERDMVVLYHDFVSEFPDRREHITSTLIDTGLIDGDSSMSRTVSLPAAIAVKLILEDKMNVTGVQIPVQKQIYEPVLEELEHLGIVCQEQTEIEDLGNA